MAEDSIDAILDRLHGVRQRGDSWQACCPAHADDKASLSIGIGDDGRILLHCHAGCVTTDIVAKLGLTMKDLAPANGHINGKPRIVSTYDYRDERGELLYQAVRMEPKDFRQRRPAEGGGWTWSTKGVRRVLYRLPGLLATDPSQTVFVAEGEKDVDNLARLGFAATCNVGGAGKWLSQYNDVLRGRPIAILPDNDQPGRDHAEKVAHNLHGVAASVKVVELPGLPPKGDVSDWLVAGGTVEELQRLVEAAPEWKPASKPKTKQEQPEAEAGLLERMTDLANARRFVKHHGEHVRYCFAWRKWVAWDGTRWKVDDDGAVDRRAKQTVDRLWQEVADESDGDKRKGLALFAARSASAGRVNAMLSLAQSETGIPVSPDQLDRDPFLLNCPNGTLDLHTGQIRPHRQEDFITKLCPTPYYPAAGCPLWEAAIDRHMGGNQTLVRYLQRVYGYSLTGCTSEQYLWIFHGVGANGKSLELGTMQDVLGQDYAMKAVADLLLVKRSESHPTERADLFGKRLVCCIETDEGRRLAESLVKELSGGDRIRARRLYENHWEFTPTHKLILAANHRPAVRGTDHAIWRRIRLVPFGVVIPDAEQDKTLPEKLKAEAPGILAWCVRGCLEWQRNGLGCPPEVQAATDGYRQEQDSLAQWMGDCCILEPSASARAAELLASYRNHSGDDRTTLTAFGKMLTERGFDKAKLHGVVWRLGIGLLADGDSL